MGSRPQLAGSVGMVSTSHWLASESGMSVLELGGNAADAAAVAGFVLQVVTPHLHGPGGEVPILLWDDAADKVLVINGQGKSSRFATIEHFQELGLNIIPGTGLLPATVPGAFGAWTLLVEQYGTWTIRQILDYAIFYAATGYSATDELVKQIQKVETVFQREWTSSGLVYLPDGQVPAIGSRFRNLALANTFQRIINEAELKSQSREGQLEHARLAFYDGFVAESISNFVSSNSVMDTSGVGHFGLLDGNDMADFDPSIEEPVKFDYGRYTLYKTRTWGQGPVLLQQLGLLSGFDAENADHVSAEFIHLAVECAKLAFADREAWYGDPDHTDVPIGGLLSDAYMDERRNLIHEQASSEFQPGAPDGRPPQLPASIAERLESDDSESHEVSADSKAIAPQHGDTCYVGVIDSRGLMISATPSGGWLQGSPIIPDLGFCLGTRGQTFWLERGYAGSLVPGGRPRTTLSPTLVTFDDRPYMAFGTSGGDQQDQWQLAFFLAHAHCGTSLQNAVELPRFHTTHFPSSFFPRKYKPRRIVVEDRVSPSIIAELKKRGHEVSVVGSWESGSRMCAVAQDLGSGLLTAAADPRGYQAYAVGR